MRGLIALFIFIAVGLLTIIVFSIIGKGLDEYEKRYLSRSTATLGEMFIFVDTRQLILPTIGAAILFGFLFTVIFHWLVGIATMAGTLALPRLLIDRFRKKRIRQFDQQLVDALSQMSSAFRAGLTFPQAAENVADEIPAPLGDEFKLLTREIKLGVSQEDALVSLSERVRSESLQLVVTATNICRQLGGNMAEIFDVISNTVRERFQIEGRVAALTSMGRIQARVVGFMPIVLGIVFYFMRPDLMEPMLAAAFGKGLLIMIVIMEFVGFFIIRRIMDIDV